MKLPCQQAGSAGRNHAPDLQGQGGFMSFDSIPHPELLIFIMAALCGACSNDRQTGNVADSGSDTGQMDDEPDPAFLFSFAVLADTHIYGNAENEIRLAAAVDWINSNVAERALELVLVVGDITWSEEGETALGLLDPLIVPYVPIIGDNEIQSAEEQAFYETFEPQYQYLAGVLDDWKMAPVPVWNPEEKKESYFINLVFEFGGLHFMALDWCARVDDELFGELADLHDFEGGTWQWFQQELAAADHEAQESIVMFSHLPMHLGTFFVDEMETIENFTNQYADSLFADFAGHYHTNFEETLEDGGYELFVTDATWDDEDTIRVVDVYGDGLRFSFQQELVVVPWDQE